MALLEKSKSISLPRPLKTFRDALQREVPTVKVNLEDGGGKPPNWWIDVQGPAGRHVTVEWRSDRGFGIFNPDRELGYGDRPDEVFRDDKKAAKRVAQFLRPRQWLRNRPWLRIIREIREVSQVELARRMRTDQAAISKLENRKNLQVSTLSKAVQALGGRIKIMAYFDDCDILLALPRSR